MSERFDHVVVGLGALGSAVTHALAQRGLSVVGLERFGLGHERGASHDASRILRHSYHTEEYVRLTLQAYDDWARLSHEAAQELVTVVGGLDLFPPGAAIPRSDYVDSLAAAGVPFDELDTAALQERWPQLRVPTGTVGLLQDDAAIVPAARGTALVQQLAVRHGAVLRDHAPVTAVRDLGGGDHEVEAGGTTYRCGGVVVCADAWTNQVLAGLGVRLPLTVTLEQATYFAPGRPALFERGRMPLWIWMDEPSFYALPCYGEPTVKAAQDCGGPVVDPDDRTCEPDAAMLRLLTERLHRILPGVGPPVRSVRCQYTLTPDRDLVLDRVPGHPGVVVGLGAAHGFKFAPTLGRLLADLVTGERDVVSPTFSLTRAALTDPTYPAHWLV